MSRVTALLLTTLLIPALGGAQGKPTAEIGTSLGLSIVSAGGSTVTHFGVPGQGILGQPTIYASIFSGRSLMIEPQLAFNLFSGEGETLTTIGLVGQIGYLVKGRAAKSLFVAGSLGVQAVSGGGSSNANVGLGGKVGYRIPVGSSLGVRFEGGYRHWFDGSLNEFTFGMGIGGIVHGK